MFGWFKKLRSPKQSVITITGSGPLLVSMERLDDTFTLHISGEAKLLDNPNAGVSFSVAMSDTPSLRQLYGLLKNALQEHEDKDMDTF